MTDMMSPGTFAGMHKNESYQELLAVKKELLDDIAAYENLKDTKEPNEYEMLGMTPDALYCCNLQCLAKICELIAEKYNA